MNRRATLLLLGALALAACSKPKPPTLTPRAAQVTAVSATGVELGVELDAHNPNGFPLMCSQVTAAFELQDGTPLGSATSSEPFTLPADGDATIQAKLQVRFSSASALAPYALAAKPVPYRLRGSARVGGENLNVEVPFSLDGVLTPEQVIAAGLHGAANLLQKR
jgi:LEA14-like dessication related protein